MPMEGVSFIICSVIKVLVRFNTDVKSDDFPYNSFFAGKEFTSLLLLHCSFWLASHLIIDKIIEKAIATNVMWYVILMYILYLGLDSFRKGLWIQFTIEYI